MRKGDNMDDYKNNDNWNHAKINQKIAEQGTWKVHQRTRQKSHTTQCAHTADSTNVTVTTI